MMRRKRNCTADPDFAEMLREAGLRATQPRLSIMDFLFHTHGPFTPDEIFQNVGAKDLDLTTVYRTTAALEKAGMLTRCEFGDGITRFELHGNEEIGNHHHHVVCRECRSVTPLEVCLPDGWKRAITSLGFTEPSHTLEFFGVCRDCRKSA